MKITKKRINRKIKQAFPPFISFCLALLVMIFVIRIFELSYISNAYKFPVGSIGYEFKGFLYDILFWLRICAWMLIPFFIFFQINRIVSYIFFWLVSGIITVGSIALLFYFGTAKVPLGADLFGYTIEEIKTTINADGGINYISIISLSLTAILTGLLFWKIRIYRIHRLAKFFIVLGLFPFLFIGNMGNANPSKFKSEFYVYIASNKAGFFLNSNLEYLIPESVFEKFKIQNNNVEKTVENEIVTDVSSSENNIPVILDSRYPLMHVDKSKDVLSKFFNQGTELPNIVFIITESLGRAYSGEGAYLGSFTPYLETLMSKGLYWSNMLSTSGRTFEALPSLLASLPFGEHGFCEMGDKMPYHQSIISILIKNGYSSSFYYGGSAKFDNMDKFMKRQGVTNIVDENNFGNGYNKMPQSKDGFSWGYGDKEIFRKYLTDLKQAPSSPRIDVLLTLAMHSPFIVDSQVEYDKKFNDQLSKIKVPDDIKEYNKQYQKQYKTILYFDDALKMLIEEYSKRPDYKNTIFIITGDHRMPEIPISTQIDRFHVPLVIWSPMLKSKGTFHSISTHYDVTPSLLAYLYTQYNIKRPSVVSWIGTGLDVNPSFRNIHSYPIMRNKSEYMDYLDQLFFLSGKTLYTIAPTMDIEPVENQTQLNATKEKFNQFWKMNLKICSENKILPDTVVIR